MCFYVCVCMWWRGVGGVWGGGMSCHISYLTQLCSRPCSRDHAVNSAHNSFWSYHRNALWYNPREAQSRWQRCLGLSRDYQTPFPVEINDRHSIDGIFFDLIFIISQISASKESKLLQNVEICQLILWKSFSNHYVKKKNNANSFSCICLFNFLLTHFELHFMNESCYTTWWWGLLYFITISSSFIFLHPSPKSVKIHSDKTFEQNPSMLWIHTKFSWDQV